MRDTKFDIRDNRLVKRSNGDPVPEDEPVFFLRGRDFLAIPALKEYLKLCKAQYCNSYQIEGVKRVIRIFQGWKQRHPERMKEPGITRGR